MQIISEGPTKITKATIEAAWRRRKPDHRVIVRDKDCRGLALVVNANTLRWEYAYRPRGADPLTGRRWANRTFTLGNPETHSPDDARAVANRLKGEIRAGVARRIFSGSRMGSGRAAASTMRWTRWWSGSAAPR